MYLVRKSFVSNNEVLEISYDSNLTNYTTLYLKLKQTSINLANMPLFDLMVLLFIDDTRTIHSKDLVLTVNNKNTLNIKLLGTGYLTHPVTYTWLMTDEVLSELKVFFIEYCVAHAEFMEKACSLLER